MCVYIYICIYYIAILDLGYVCIYPQFPVEWHLPFADFPSQGEQNH